MATQEKRYDSDSDLSMNIPVPIHEPYPFFPPPPTAIKKKPLRTKQAAAPIEDIPPLPKFNPDHFLPVPPPPSPPVPDTEFPGPPSPQLSGKFKRKTLMQRVEGWWDLGLLEKRQTLFGRGSVVSTARRA